VPLSNRLNFALKATRELGLYQVGMYAYYQFALRSGLYRRLTPPRKPLQIKSPEFYEVTPGLVKIPSQEALTAVLGENAAALFAEATELGKNKIRLFGGPPQDLNFIVPLPLEHWTEFSLNPDKAGEEDIKFTWEPARFTWVYTLMRAYVLSGDEAYVETFWQGFEAFSDINLTNMGPNWVSAQEVAIRLISFCFAHQVFSSAAVSSPERVTLLQVSIADHAARIPATLAYARAQNNNHLLTEAAGLITAGICLSNHPKAEAWRTVGWKWFNQALQNQIAEDGTYIQHSANYHRLMLQAALWIYSLDNSFPEEVTEKLAAATRWLSILVEPATGRAPNLGHNDGSYLQPLTSCPYHDYRPVVQAAAQAFLGERFYPPGPWDEYPLWLGQEIQDENETEDTEAAGKPGLEVNEFHQSHFVVRNEGNQSWACLRVAKFDARPAHADQLHLDLWWQGHNLAQDAGSYLYNADAPWNNSLVQTGVHNTITIDEQDQMTPAGRFLWLDWAQAEIINIDREGDGSGIRLIAQHNGYRKIGVAHQRTVSTSSDGKWIIEDILQSSQSKPSKSRQTTSFDERNPTKPRIYQACLHWLLPDWTWEIDQTPDNLHTTLRLRSPKDWLEMVIGIEPATRVRKEPNLAGIRIYRAGEAVYGTDLGEPIKGWISPTYGYKVPALALEVRIESHLPIRFRTEWDLP
jgi:hypothetical protein